MPKTPPQHMEVMSTEDKQYIQTCLKIQKTNQLNTNGDECDRGCHVLTLTLEYDNC